MRKVVLVLAASALLLGATAACSDDDGDGASAASVGCPSPATTGTPPGTRLPVTSGGQERSAYVWLPEGYDGSGPVPLVADFHGAGSDALEHEGEFSTMAEDAPRRGYLVVAGDALPNEAGGVGWRNEGTAPSADAQFTRDLIDAVAARYCVDRSRLYVTGYSSGGGFAAHAGCHLPELAAVAPLAGVSLTRPCDGQPPMPMITLHGDADTFVPFTGMPGLSDPDAPPSAGFIGDVVDTVGRWAARNGCGPEPVETRTGSEQTQDAATVRTYQGCTDGADVVLHVLHGADHLYPGGVRGSAELQDDPRLSKVQASEVVLDFFDAHTRQ